MTGALLGLLACAPPVTQVVARPVSGGVEVAGDGPMHRITLLDPRGQPVITRVLPAPAEDAWLEALLEPGGAYQVLVDGAVRADVSAPAAPLRIGIAAPLGQDLRAISAGDAVDVAVADGAPVDVGVVLSAAAPFHGVLHAGSQDVGIDLAAGDQRTVVLVLTDAGPLIVAVGGLTFTLTPSVITAARAAETLSIAGTAFPSDPDGSVDRSRPPGVIALPAAWWEAGLRWLDVGARPADSQAPWGLESVTVANDGDVPLNLVVQSRILDDLGQPVHALRPRLRDADGGVDAVRALIRVPAHASATAVLPVWVDRGAVEGGTFDRELSVTALGATRPWVQRHDPLVVSRGSATVSLFFVASLAAAAGGWAFLGLRLRSWLTSWATSDLTTVALFASLGLVVAVASQVVATPMTALLGPFAPMVVGLFDDAVRAALLATLVTLLPRPGVATLELLTGTLLRTLAFGMVSPVDALYVGASILWLEGALWLSGLTRTPSWRDEAPTRRWLRLSAGLGAASVLQAATGLAAHVVVYRLFYAPWYVASDLLLPSGLYVVLACALAVPFADSLRRVEP